MSDGAQRSAALRVAALVLATLSVTAGLALREALGVWLATGLGGGAAAALILAVDAGRLRAWLEASPGDIALGVVAGASMAAATHLLYAPLADRFPVVRQQVLQLYGVIDAPPGAVAALPVVAVVIVAEELVWRGEAMDLLSRRLGPAPTVACAALLYVVPQIGIGSWLLALVAFGCGLVWSALRAWSGSVVAPLLAHLVWDLMLFALLPLT